MKIKWTLLLAIIIWTVSSGNYELIGLKKGDKISLQDGTRTRFYTIDRCIGSGASAVVYADNTKWALQIPYKEESLLNEVEIVNYLATKVLETVNTSPTNASNPQKSAPNHLLAYHLIYFEVFGVYNRSQMPIILMPLLGMSLSCLKSKLTNESPLHPYLPPLIVYYWTIQMMAALKFIHSFGIVHRDLTLRNLLLEKNYNRIEIGSQETNLIIIDFSLGRITNAESSALKWQQHSVSMAQSYQGQSSKVANASAHTDANARTVNGKNNTKIGQIHRHIDVLMVEKSLSQFIHPTERFGDIFTDVDAWHREDLPFEPVLYEQVISSVKKRIRALNSYEKSGTIA